MQIEVANRWYRLYNYFLLGASVLIFSGSVLTTFVKGLSHYGVDFDFTTLTTVLAFVYIIHGIVYYPFFAKQQTHFHAAMLSALLFLTNELNLLYRTHGIPFLLYVFIWLIMTAFSGMFGLEVILEWNFLATFFILFEAKFTISHISTGNAVFLVSTYVLSFILYYVLWNSLYQKSKSHGLQQLSHLSSMLKDNQSQSEILVESIADGVIVFNNERKITLMNQAAANMTEWAIKDAIGIDADLIVKLANEKGVPLKDNEDPFRLVLKNKNHIQQNLMLISRQQKKIVVSLVISPVALPSEEEGVVVGGVAVIRDISAQRQAEQQRADFISTASHEMRTPVAAIEGYLSLAMNDHVSSIDSRAREYLEKAHASTRQLGKLFQDLLTSSKAEDGRLVNHPEVVDMGEFIGQLSENFQLAAQKKNLYVELVNNESDPTQASITGKVIRPLYYVYVDPDRMREVITNLFDNAVKYTESGKITLGIGGTKDSVEFFIKDTGLGIAQDDLPHLFQKFYRVDNSAVRTIGGTGLGLYICKKIVELYRGKIWADSEVGVGSTFHISLPRLNNQQAESLKSRKIAEDQINIPVANPS